MHFVDDKDLEPTLRRAGVCHRVQLSDIVNASRRRGVDFKDVKETTLRDADARLANTARFSRGATGAIGAHAVQPFGDDPGGGGFTGAADAGHDESMRDAVCLEGIFQRAHHRLLADKIGKGFRPVFPGQNLIGGGG